MASDFLILVITHRALRMVRGSRAWGSGISGIFIPPALESGRVRGLGVKRVKGGSTGQMGVKGGGQSGVYIFFLLLSVSGRLWRWKMEDGDGKTRVVSS